MKTLKYLWAIPLALLLCTLLPHAASAQSIDELIDSGDCAVDDIVEIFLDEHGDNSDGNFKQFMRWSYLPRHFTDENGMVVVPDPNRPAMTATSCTFGTARPFVITRC